VNPPSIEQTLEKLKRFFANLQSKQCSEEWSPIENVFYYGFTQESFLSLNIGSIRCTNQDTKNDLITLLNTWRNSIDSSFADTSTGIPIIKIAAYLK
jgi:hypothetical protein